MMMNKRRDPVSIGIKYVKKANMWNFHITYNFHDATDVNEWFMTEEEAQARLKKEQDEQ